jgi:hypothetical protein
MHQGVGALLLASAVAFVLHAFRRLGAGPEPIGAGGPYGRRTAGLEAVA